MRLLLGQLLTEATLHYQRSSVLALFLSVLQPLDGLVLELLAFSFLVDDVVDLELAARRLHIHFVNSSINLTYLLQIY